MSLKSNPNVRTSFWGRQSRTAQSIVDSPKVQRDVKRLKEAMREQKRFTAGGETCRQWGDRLLAEAYDSLPTIPSCD